MNQLGTFDSIYNSQTTPNPQNNNRCHWQNLRKTIELPNAKSTDSKVSMTLDSFSYFDNKYPQYWGIPYTGLKYDPSTKFILQEKPIMSSTALK